MHDYLFLISQYIAPGHINDMWFRFWDREGTPPGQFNDRMHHWLGKQGYTGSLTDRYAAWRRDYKYTWSGCFEKPDGELLENYSFECGLRGWVVSDNYDAVLSYNGDGSIKVESRSEFGSAQPVAKSFPAATYVLKVHVTGLVGSGKMSIQKTDGTWTSWFFDQGDGIYTGIHTGDIKNINVGASQDAAAVMDLQFVSLKEEKSAFIYHNGVEVTFNGDQVLI